MNICLNLRKVAGASSYTSSQSIYHTALPPLRATLYWYAYFMFFPINGIRTAMNYYFKTDKYAWSCVVASENGFGSASFTKITTHISWTSYSYCWDGLGASEGYSTGITFDVCCIMAESCI